MQLLYADYVVVYVLLQPWLGLTANCYMIALSFLCVSMLAKASHCRCMLTDPGSVPLEFQPSHLLAEQNGNLPMCSRCNGYKPMRAHHCSQCDRCHAARSKAPIAGFAPPGQPISPNRLRAAGAS